MIWQRLSLSYLSLKLKKKGKKMFRLCATRLIAGRGGFRGFERYVPKGTGMKMIRHGVATTTVVYSGYLSYKFVNGTRAATTDEERRAANMDARYAAVGFACAALAVFA